MRKKIKKKKGRPMWIPTPQEVEKAKSLAARGLTKEQIAHCLGISYDTLNERCKILEDFSESIKKGQSLGISIVANSLFEAAKSGNITAQIFYLKCRAHWKETLINEIDVKQEDAIKELA